MFPARRSGSALTLCLMVAACGGPQYDTILRGGSLIDGSGSPAVTADVAFSDGVVAAVGDLGRARGIQEFVV